MTVNRETVVHCSSVTDEWAPMEARKPLQISCNDQVGSTTGRCPFLTVLVKNGEIIGNRPIGRPVDLINQYCRSMYTDGNMIWPVASLPAGRIVLPLQMPNLGRHP